MYLHNIRPFIFLLATMLITGCATQARVSTTQADDPDFLLLANQMQSKEQGQALATLKKLTGKHPDNASIFVNYAIIYRQQGKTLKMHHMLDKAIAISKHHPEANNLLGILHRESGEFQKALTAYQRALKTDSDYALAHYNLGILYDIYLQDLSLAEKHYKRYLSLHGQADKQVSGWLSDLKRRK